MNWIFVLPEFNAICRIFDFFSFSFIFEFLNIGKSWEKNDWFNLLGNFRQIDSYSFIHVHTFLDISQPSLIS